MANMDILLKELIMNINNKSVFDDVLQAIAGTWNLSEDNGWRCAEIGKTRIFKKILKAGSNVLPEKFLKYRKEVAPVLLFTKDNLTGQTLNLQQNAIEVNENCLAIIIDF